VLFRALKPYLTYKREFDRAMVVQREFDRAMVVRVENVEAELFERRRRQSEQIARLEALVEDLVSTAESLRRRIADDEQALGAEQALRAELQAVPYIADSPFEQFESLVGDVTGYRSLNSAAGAASPYAGFEDLFRGPAERVTELQRPYLGLVAEHQPVLDVGCGRGEFLALLAAEGIVARGVDSDRGMIERCRAQGLPVALAGALEYLEGLDDASLGTVFCAQVIEHLTADQLRQLLELARRKLEPGGLFIAETINPHSIPALKMFWVDLTHQHPVFPEVALALCALAGFGPAYVFAPGYPSFEAARFDATSYAVVATSPGSAER
jgi:2-polyprenyl-3-methyl-5-hydroxy-6-metoxy-1,4-benzoquinol methylase